MKWYELDRARLVLEHLRVLEKYRHFVLLRSDSGSLYWLGEIQPVVGGITPAPLLLRVEYPDSFPAEYPEAFVMKPALPEDHVGHKWHRWPTVGTICYVKPKNWQLGTTVDDVISKCEDWYFNYVAVTNGLAEEMPDIGRLTLKG